ncbi:ArsR/SmtB family transcription factor [Kribbella sp. NPDC048928]|uniref:ArsR/SmtB family transcription factor n=1 Tax=Kribbella sp. NPDC048928 TaxID=3364111 RepID=UPI003713B31B
MTSPAPAIVSVMSALADDTRWQILTSLGDQPASASALARQLPVSRQAINKHLDVLKAVGLVESRTEGRELVFHALGGQLSRLAEELERIGRVWDRRLERIRRQAERPRSTPGS